MLYFFFNFSYISLVNLKIYWSVSINYSNVWDVFLFFSICQVLGVALGMVGRVGWETHLLGSGMYWGVARRTWGKPQA